MSVHKATLRGLCVASQFIQLRCNCYITQMANNISHMTHSVLIKKIIQQHEWHYAFLIWLTLYWQNHVTNKQIPHTLADVSTHKFQWNKWNILSFPCIERKKVFKSKQNLLFCVLLNIVGTWSVPEVRSCYNKTV